MPGDRTVYCTVCAENYLPQAMALAESVRRHDPDVPLVVLVVDADRGDLAAPGLEFRTTDSLGLDPVELDDLQAIYDVVEFSTALKPVFFLALLEEYARVVYLDPDTCLTTSLETLNAELAVHPAVLTPHFLDPVPHGTGHISDVHALTVGVYNLGFAAFSTEARPLLEWWWSKLRRDCLIYPLLGIFVDQKWMDLGAVLFGAHALADPGVNVGPWNLHERPIERSGDALVVAREQQGPLRLFHFSGFDPERPEALSVRLNTDLQAAAISTSALAELAETYAESVLRARAALAPLHAYRFATDASGARIPVRLRRVYRAALLAGRRPPSLFDPAVIAEVRRWKRSIAAARIGSFAADAAIASKYASPDVFAWGRRRLGPRFVAVRRTLLGRNDIRR